MPPPARVAPGSSGAPPGGAARLVAAIQGQLGTRWLARELYGLDQTDSTNRVASELAAEGAAHGTTVLAESQSQGRGRHGRSFFSPPGRNLYTSVILRPEGGRIAPTSVLAAGVAVARTAADWLGDPARVSIKWPNDVLLDGRKTSGILMEGSNAGVGAVAVLGIGVNLNVERDELPEEFRSRATSVATACGNPVDRGDFAARLYGTLERVLDLHDQQGFEGIRGEFETFFRMVGQQLRVADLDGRPQAEGTALGVGSDGALRLRGPDGQERRVLAGDVTVVKEEPA